MNSSGEVPHEHSFLSDKLPMSWAAKSSTGTADKVCSALGLMTLATIDPSAR